MTDYEMIAGGIAMKSEESMRWPRGFAFGYITVLCVAGMTTSGTLGEQPSMHDVRDLLLRISDDGDAATALNAILQMRREDAVAGIIDALADPRISRRGDMRETAYRALASLGDDRVSLAREQLIACLSDPSSEIVRICCEALDNATLSRQRDLRLSVLKNPMSSRSTKRSALADLSRWGEYARGAVETASSILSDADAHEPSRIFAARIMLHAGDLAKNLEHFAQLDSVGMKLVIPELVRHMREGRAPARVGELMTMPPLRDATAFVLQALEHEDSGVRGIAIKSLDFLVGDAMFSTVTSSDYELDSEYEVAVRKVVDTDNDQTLKFLAMKLLDPNYLSSRAEIIRSREVKTSTDMLRRSP